MIALFISYPQFSDTSGKNRCLSLSLEEGKPPEKPGKNILDKGSA